MKKMMFLSLALSVMAIGSAMANDSSSMEMGRPKRVNVNINFVPECCDKPHSHHIAPPYGPHGKLSHGGPIDCHCKCSEYPKHGPKAPRPKGPKFNGGKPNGGAPGGCPGTPPPPPGKPNGKPGRR